MRFTQEIFEILSKGGFICSNSLDRQRSLLYDAIEDDFAAYQDYFQGIGFVLESGDGYYYFSRNENRVILADKLQRMSEWIDYVDFLKTYNSAFGPGFSFRKSNIVEKFSSDIELKEKVQNIYPDKKTSEEKIEALVDDMLKQGFVEKEDDLDNIYRVTSAFHYIEELIDCLTIIETDQA